MITWLAKSPAFDPPPVHCFFFSFLFFPLAPTSKFLPRVLFHVMLNIIFSFHLIGLLISFLFFEDMVVRVVGHGENVLSFQL